MADTTPLPRDTQNATAIQGTFRTMANGTRKTVASAGTAVQLVSAATPCKALIVQALFSNTKVIAIGDSTTLATVGSESGLLLNPGSSVTLPVVDVSSVYIDALVNSEGVVFVSFV